MSLPSQAPPYCRRGKRRPRSWEALNHAIGAALLLKQLEDGSNGTLYFLVRIKNDILAVEYQTNWQREAQLTFLRFVEFAAVEARANNVQFGLSERTFHAKD